LQLALEKFAELEVIEVCENGLQAVKAVNELKPQLLFLDIQMPKLDGFDVLELLGDQAPFVIFVTAYDEYAVQAFKANAVDYLMKPLDPERLEQTVQKIIQRIATEHPAPTSEWISKSVRENELLQRILVRDGSDVHVLAVNSVCYIESADDYVAIQTEDATHIKLDRLNKLEEKLNPRQFCRIHRSYILNINYLSRIEAETKDSKLAILTNGKVLPISRSGYGLLKKLL
jgi:two-component system LytT family response regulator|tara:strand:+ start:75554 stop:76243 length:690 start_codon:yes stop_codon:yes gene_type:complete